MTKSSPDNVTETSLYCMPTELQESEMAKLIPSLTKIHISSWLFQTKHLYCKEEPYDKIPHELRRFDLSFGKDGKEYRSPKLVTENGIIKPVFEFMKTESLCKVCYHCSYCNRPLCCDPISPTSTPCNPTYLPTLLKTPEYWDSSDYIFYYVTKSHKQLSIQGIDAKAIVHGYKTDTLTGKAEELFYKTMLNSENGIEICEYVDKQFDLKGRWKDFR